MEWIKAILEKHTGEDGVLNLAEAQKEINAEFPKNAVPKADFNSKVEELKSANDTLNKLQKDNKDVEALQTTITDYKSQIETLEAERAEERKTYALKEALTKEGASDIEYMLYKLGEVEVDKDGNIVDLENKVKALKETNPTFFASEAKNNEPGAPGYQVVDNKLDNGQPSDPVATASAEFEKSLGLATE